MASMATWLQNGVRKTHMYLSSDSLLIRMSLILSIFKSSPSISSTVTAESAMDTTSSSSEGQRERETKLMHHWQILILFIFKEPKPNNLNSNDICSLRVGLELTLFRALCNHIFYTIWKRSQAWSCCRYLCSHTQLCVSMSGTGSTSISFPGGLSL